ncbi:hypothetical protein Hbl1158_15100 (plasmid) [Halobaculum sp. CBA1158]|uniref:hypothetical protein n=1 Tax=Halobaculum sp. CBA1158 TaxID=2904243 RepID=UPI001F3E28D3|nr:hypothetical protein [Halobaculum sp. CBA1158]UIP01462.1 hypothetical protein Hbl1158_15100 [Halobaculum sp. CBA1158]
MRLVDIERSAALPAVAAALAGLAATALSLSVANPYPRVIGPLVLAGVLGWVVLRRRRPEPIVPSFDADADAATALVAIAALCAVAATAVLYASAGYRRTIPVHVGLVVLLVSALVLALLVEGTALRIGILLGVGVFHRATVYYASALQIGNDAVWHTRIAGDVVAAGSLEPLATAGSKYWFMPLHHLQIAAVSAVGEVSPRHATFLGVTVPLVVVPVATAYAIAAGAGRPRVGVVAGWLYLAADRAIGQSVHAIPTSTGVAFAGVAVLGVLGAVASEDDRPWLAVVLAALAALWLTHPVALFVTGVLAVSVGGGYALWAGRGGRTVAAVAGATTLAGISQAAVVGYQGPGSSDTILDRVAAAVALAVADIGAGGETTAPPATEAFVPTGSASLSVLQVVGVGALFGLGVVGALVWLSTARERTRPLVGGLGVAAAATAAGVFVPPALGVGFLFPYRWFAYLYLPLSVLGGAGLVAVAGAVSSAVASADSRAGAGSGSDAGSGVRGTRDGRSHDGGRRGPFGTGTASRGLGPRHAAAALVVLVVVAAPYAAAMSWNAAGSLDDPVLDDSPTAQRLGVTTTEAAAYEFVADNGNGVTAVADRIAANHLERGAEYPTATYAIAFDSREPTVDGERLLVDRAYAHTDHASFYVRYGGRWHAVYGPLPVDRETLDREHGVVFVAGDDRVVYAAGDE